MVLGTRVYEYGTGLFNAPLVVCTGVSGGTKLSGSSNIFSMTVINISGNSPVWVGNAPVSGTGAILYPGAAIDLRVDNSNDVAVCAEVSGQRISWLGILK